MFGRTPRRALVAVSLAACAVTAAALPAPAGAASAWPAAPSGVHLSRIADNGTGFTVTAARAGNATAYRVYASPTESDLFGSGFTSPSRARVVATSKTPTVVVTGLRYVAAPIYYRFRTLHGTNGRMTGIRTLNLRPSTPTSFSVAATRTRGTYLTWNSSAVTGSVVQQSIDKTMRTGVTSYTVRGLINQFTPPSLAKGRTYYFRVRSMNGTTPSAWTATRSAVPVTSVQSLTFMTYNILTATTDGRVITGEKIASWNPARRAAMAALVKPVSPDVIAVQEGSAYNSAHQRQVDTFASSLGRDYSVAATETLYPNPGYFRSDDYIVYRNTTWQAVGRGGYFYTGYGLYAAYQTLRNRASGAEVLVVSVHLSKGSTNDAVRKSEAQAIVAEGARLAASRNNVPVVYAGDYSSALAHWHPNDAPAAVMHGIRATDASFVAPRVTNSAWDTANEYRRVAPHAGILVDRAFGSAGVAVTGWRQVLDISGGKFVGTIASDHNPVLINLQVPAAPIAP